MVMNHLYRTATIFLILLFVLPYINHAFINYPEVDTRLYNTLLRGLIVGGVS